MASESKDLDDAVPVCAVPFHRRVWWVRYLFYSGMCLGLLVVLYGAIEIWGHFRWNTHVAAIKASGGSLNLEELIRTPATEESFWRDPFIEAIISSRSGPLSEGTEAIRRGDPDFDDLSAGFRTRAGWLAARSVSLEYFFPKLALSREQAAERILVSIKPLEENISRLIRAIDRPPSAFPWSDISEPWEGNPRVFRGAHFQEVCKLLKYRNLCLLEAGRPAEAAVGVLASIRLCRHVQFEGSVMDVMFRNVIFEIGQQTIWEGLSRGAWSESELSEMQIALSEVLDSTPTLSDALALERSLEKIHFEEMYSSPGKRWENADGNFRQLSVLNFRDSVSEWKKAGVAVDSLNRVLFTLLPTPVWRENLIFRHQLNEATLLNPALPFSEQVRREAEVIESIENSLIRNPTKLLSNSQTGSAWVDIRRIVSWIESIRAAIAAERFRNAHGAYPKSWSDFVPAWLPAIPKDPFSGGDQIYLIGPDGRPVIYSVGVNGVDDGGTPRRNREAGDEVWRYSLPPGFSAEDFWK
jgi:hypothetical protein